MYNLQHRSTTHTPAGKIEIEGEKAGKIDATTRSPIIRAWVDR